MDKTGSEVQGIYHQARKQATELIYAERDRQDDKWGISRHNAKTWLTIALEEIGELSHEILAGTPEGAQKELVQCASVFHAMLEQFMIDGIANSMEEYEFDNGVLVPKYREEPETLRCCHWCGNELPESDCYQRKGEWFCNEDHANYWDYGSDESDTP